MSKGLAKDHPALSDFRSRAERDEARKRFEVAMRQAVMEFDSLLQTGVKELDFREFSRLIREREVGVHSEYALRKRFDALDADSSGTVDMGEFITFSLRDAFVRSQGSHSAARTL